MAKIKSFITEADVGVLSEVDVQFISLVGHAANRQPFKIIKGEVKGEHVMPKTAIYSVLVPTGIMEEKFQEIVETHNFSVEEKVEDQLEGYVVYKQVADEDVDLDTKKMAQLQDGAFVIVADLKEESEKEGVEKEEFEYETLDKVADSLFAMMDIVLGTMRQPEAEGTSRKEMIMTAVSNFSSYVNAVLANTKAEDVIENIEIKSEILKSFLEPEEKEEIEEFDQEAFETKIKEELTAEFTKALDEKFEEIKTEFAATKETLNTSLNEHLEIYSKKEDVEKEIGVFKEELENIKNTAKTRNSQLDETKIKKSETPKKKINAFTTFV